MKHLIFFTLCFLCIFCASNEIEVSPSSVRARGASMITPVSAVKYYQQVVEYLGKRLGVPAEIVHRTTYDEIDVMLEEGLVDIAFICSAPYVMDNEKFGAELLVAPMTEEVSVFGQKQNIGMEAIMLAIAEKLGLANFGKDGFGGSQALERVDD